MIKDISLLFISLVDNWFDEFSISFLVKGFARKIPFQSLFTIEKNDLSVSSW